MFQVLTDPSICSLVMDRSEGHKDPSTLLEELRQGMSLQHYVAHDRCGVEFSRRGAVIVCCRVASSVYASECTDASDGAVASAPRWPPRRRILADLV